ncbi:minor capsid protein [Paenibacillus sp. OAE614]|uniref:minor capsid protein n=1 Tax=Paenibacillus sp. OAE614 TaxID=2663804 RepID=UPI001789A076
MIKPRALADFLQEAIAFTFYANEFPVNGEESSAYVRLTGGYAPSEWTSMAHPSFQVIVRGPAAQAVQTEAVADRIHTFLHQKREFDVGEEHIRFCTADQSSPIYVGRDENGRLLYSINFTCVIA